MHYALPRFLVIVNSSCILQQNNPMLVIVCFLFFLEKIYLFQFKTMIVIACFLFFESVMLVYVICLKTIFNFQLFFICFLLIQRYIHTEELYNSFKFVF